MCLSIQSRLAERDSQVRSGVPFLSRERIENLTIQGLIQSNPQGFSRLRPVIMVEVVSLPPNREL